MKFVAVTACPTGIAHSQMAAENLERVAEATGHEIDVEIQGAMGTENELSGESIEAADAVIIAAATSVERDRFDGKPLVAVPVQDAVNGGEGLLDRAVEVAKNDGAAGADDGRSEPPRPDQGPLERGVSEGRADERANGLLARLRRFFS
ncbi:PTS fructose transporter subunit IIB [Natronosalvus caseinilyticus]|uniref:PTS fructose transporter subunit IIB n=1 Tax=Natronosalvus caseinilyticus TaxID=2953747 RepID=UPI0028AA9D66|nr:fructose PTS transporter subunit IIB [Natronosalvus caseinilyticus]